MNRFASGLAVSEDAKEILAAMAQNDGRLTRLRRRFTFRIGPRYFHDDQFRRWVLAIEELSQLGLISGNVRGDEYELTLPGERSGVMMLSAEARQQAENASPIAD